MAQEIINVGTAPNDGQGDPIREAFTKCNDNFTELFSGSSSNAISNGNSVVRISTANGNISMSVSGTANVAVVTTTGITVSNTVAAATLTSAGTVSAAGNVTGGNILTVGNITGGNIDAVNLVINRISSDDSTFITIEDGVIVNGVISAAGNITGANFETFGNISTTGVVNATVVLASGVGVPATGVTTFNLANARATTINFGGEASNIFIANVNSTTQVAGNLTAGGLISATGNITGNNINSTTTFRLAVFANATVRDSSIASPVVGMMIYVTGTGMQVRGATSWNTVAGTGT
jgi:filamentous hemagglutinin